MDLLRSLASAFAAGCTQMEIPATAAAPIQSHHGERFSVNFEEFVQWVMDKEAREGTQPTLPLPVTRTITGPAHFLAVSPPRPTRHVTVGSIATPLQKLHFQPRRQAATSMVTATATRPSTIAVTTSSAEAARGRPASPPPPPPPPATTTAEAPPRPALTTAETNCQVGRGSSPRTDGSERGRRSRKSQQPRKVSLQTSERDEEQEVLVEVEPTTTAPSPVSTRPAATTAPTPALATAMSQVGRGVPPRTDGPEREEKRPHPGGKHVTWHPSLRTSDSVRRHAREDEPRQEGEAAQERIPQPRRATAARTRPWSRWDKLCQRTYPGHKKAKGDPGLRIPETSRGGSGPGTA